MPTFAPSCAKRIAVARPMPLAAPVMKAAFPSSIAICVPLFPEPETAESTNSTAAESMQRRSRDACDSRVAPEEKREPLDELLLHRPSRPLVVGDAVAFREVVVEVFLQACRQVSGARCGVDLVVQAERAVVEVGAAEHAPRRVDDQHLGVVHRREVFVDLNAALEQVAVK